MYPCQKLIEHGWDFDPKEHYILRETSAYQNAWAYGDIPGEGISVYCSHNDEAVWVFQETSSMDETIDLMLELGWEITQDYGALLRFTKGHDIAIFEGNGHSIGYLSTYVDTEYRNECNYHEIEDFFDDLVYVVEDEVYDETGEWEHNTETEVFHSMEKAEEYFLKLKYKSIPKFTKRFESRSIEYLHDDHATFRIATLGGKVYYYVRILTKKVR